MLQGGAVDRGIQLAEFHLLLLRERVPFAEVERHVFHRKEWDLYMAGWACNSRENVVTLPNYYVTIIPQQRQKTLYK